MSTSPKPTSEELKLWAHLHKHRKGSLSQRRMQPASLVRYIAFRGTDGRLYRIPIEDVRTELQRRDALAASE